MDKDNYVYISDILEVLGTRIEKPVGRPVNPTTIGAEFQWFLVDEGNWITEEEDLLINNY